MASAPFLGDSKETLELDDAAFGAPFHEAPTTKQAASLLGGWGQPSGVLVVLGPDEARTALSFRNLDRVSVLPAENVGVADLVGASAVLTTRSAVDALTRRATGVKEA